MDKWFFWVGQGAKTTPISTGAKKEAAAATKIATGTVPVKGGTIAKVAATGGGVSEEEAKALLRQSGPIKSQDLVAKFKSRLKTQEVCLLSLSSHYVICFIGVPQKVSVSQYDTILLKERTRHGNLLKRLLLMFVRRNTDLWQVLSKGLLPCSLCVISQGLKYINVDGNAFGVQDKTAFAQILKKISRIQKTDGVNYIVLRDK